MAHITVDGLALEGGRGSGNFGHVGRKGKIGGSSGAGGSGAVSSESSPKDSTKGKIGGKSKKGFPSHYGEGAEAYADEKYGSYAEAEVARLESGIPVGIKEREPGFLKNIEFTEEVNKGASSGKQRLCFQSAAEFVIGNEGWEAVHATLYPRLGAFRNKIYFHAFAQKGNVVYDGVFDKFYNKEEYYEHYSITDIRVFSQEKVISKALATKVWGAWDD